MTLPFFSAGDDPGPRFARLLKRCGRRARLDRSAPRAPAARDHPRHHRGRHPLRRRRGHGRRPAGDRRQPHQPPHDGEGVPRRPPLGRRHRRRRRPGHRDGQAVPAPARALREGRGRPAVAWRARPTSSPRWSAATCPPPCRASRSCPLFAGYDTTPRHRPALRVRRHRRPLRGERLRRHRLRQPPRRHRRQARLPARPRPRRRHRPGDQRPVPGGRRGLGHRRARPRPRHLPGDGHHHGRRLRPARRRRGRRALPGAARPAVDPGEHHDRRAPARPSSEGGGGR